MCLRETNIPITTAEGSELLSVTTGTYSPLAGSGRLKASAAIVCNLSTTANMYYAFSNLAGTEGIVIPPLGSILLTNNSQVVNIQFKSSLGTISARALYFTG